MKEAQSRQLQFVILAVIRLIESKIPTPHSRWDGPAHLDSPPRQLMTCPPQRQDGTRPAFSPSPSWNSTRTSLLVR